MIRPDKDLYFITISTAIALRASCSKRAVGCVLVDSNYNILSTGYNGPPSKFPYCNPCYRESSPSGLGLDNCVAIHAEQNALLQCPSTQGIYTAYVTHSPCIQCVKMLMNTSCNRIVFLHEYPHHLSKQWWLDSKVDREWVQVNPDPVSIDCINGLLKMRGARCLENQR